MKQRYVSLTATVLQFLDILMHISPEHQQKSPRLTKLAAAAGLTVRREGTTRYRRSVYRHRTGNANSQRIIFLKCLMCPKRHVNLDYMELCASSRQCSFTIDIDNCTFALQYVQEHRRSSDYLDLTCGNIDPTISNFIEFHVKKVISTSCDRNSN